MAYLLNTDIEAKIHAHIRGSIARVGGTVHQIVDYRNTRVTDLNLLDGGHGYIKRWRDIRSFRNLLGTIKRHVTQEYKHFRLGETVPLDRRTIILDAHDAYKHPELKHRFDACITSNVVEHSPNPLFFLLNCYFVTKKGGWQYHAIPHYKYTFDMYREPTPFAHFIEDLEKKTDLDDTTHVADYVQSAMEKHGWQKKRHNVYPITYPYIHHHVYDEFNTREMAEFMFSEVTNDIFKTDANSDNVVIFRNTLNPTFLKKYGHVVDRYSKAFLHNK